MVKKFTECERVGCTGGHHILNTCYNGRACRKRKEIPQLQPEGGTRHTLFAGVRPCPSRAGNGSFLFVVYCYVSLMFASVAVRVAVQADAVQQCLRNEWKQESDDPSPKEQAGCCAMYRHSFLCALCFAVTPTGTQRERKRSLSFEDIWTTEPRAISQQSHFRAECLNG